MLEHISRTFLDREGIFFLLKRSFRNFQTLKSERCSSYLRVIELLNSTPIHYSLLYGERRFTSLLFVHCYSYIIRAENRTDIY